MNRWPACWRIILIVVAAGLAGGCMPISDGPRDDEKDPNFVEGRNHQNAMDYKGAIASFERAVRANPGNAAAHLELGLLYEQNLRDYGSAIYHFQKHLQLRPKSAHLDVVNQHITTCKMELAKTVTFGVVTQEVHRDLQRLTNEIHLLRQANDQLRAQLAVKPTVVTQWMTLRVTNTIAPPTGQFATNPAPKMTNVAMQPRLTNTVSRTQTPTHPVRPAARSYTVRPGETMSQIARRHKISLEKLRAANSSVSPSRMRPGQVLVIPSE